MFFFLVTPRTSQGLYPELPPIPPSPAARPSAPPMDPGYGGSSGLSASSDSSVGSDRGVVRPHSDSPFRRNVKTRGLTAKEEEIDLEAISCLVDFASRSVTTPSTPAAAPRPERPPPPVISSRRPPGHLVRPRALRSTPPAAAMGAPPQADRESPMEDEELPDIPDTPASPAISDITVLRLVLFCFKKKKMVYCIFKKGNFSL